MPLFVAGSTAAVFTHHSRTPPTVPGSGVGPVITRTSFITADGRPPLFTDFGYAALGVPRNAAIAHNGDPAYVGLGLCGPLRADLAQPALCGLFRTPGLRNVAQRPVFFHDGVFRSLADVVAFCNTRDTQPQRCYPSVGGAVQAFDDLPAPHRANLARQAPLDGRPAGAAPPMTDAETADLVCFLRALSDGHVPGTPPQAGCPRATRRAGQRPDGTLQRSPSDTPMPRAASSISWSSGTLRVRPATSSSETLTQRSPCSATMRPYSPAFTSCAAW